MFTQSVFYTLYDVPKIFEIITVRHSPFTGTRVFIMGTCMASFCYKKHHRLIILANSQMHRF